MTKQGVGYWHHYFDFLGGSIYSSFRMLAVNMFNYWEVFFPQGALILIVAWQKRTAGLFMVLNMVKTPSEYLHRTRVFNYVLLLFRIQIWGIAPTQTLGCWGRGGRGTQEVTGGGFPYALHLTPYIKPLLFETSRIWHGESWMTGCILGVQEFRLVNRFFLFPRRYNS